MPTAKELQDQGIKLFDQRDYEAAARAFQDAKEAYGADNQPDMAAEMKVNLGLVHRALGEHQQALDLMQEALRTFQDANDQLRLAQVLGNLGGVYLALNDKEQAFESYRRAADIFDELGEKKLYGETMLALGNLQFRDGRIFAGAALYQVGLDQLDNLNPRQKMLKRVSNFLTRLSGGKA